MKLITNQKEMVSGGRGASGIMWKCVIYCTEETKGNSSNKQAQKKRETGQREHMKETTVLWHLVVKV